MTDDTVLVPGAREVRATLDSSGDASACVVACPPHPQMGGNRSDKRLVAVSEALPDDVDCLRIDYGAWDEGYGEREDARNAVRWAAERYDEVGLFGFSFGGCIAVLTAASVDVETCAVSALAPASRLEPDLDAVAALDELRCPLQVIVGERDTTADWEPLADAARERGHEVVEFSADHFFIGQQEKAAELVVDFLVPRLR